jgi:hypothetical protein
LELVEPGRWAVARSLMRDSKSEVQLTDVRNLLQSVRGLNRRYLARWAKELGVETLYREVTR